jgi:hypothetical protein
LRNQEIRVKWANLLSDPFTASNGVKQGGVLWPILFNLYLDQLILNITKSKVGCRVGQTYASIFAYADGVIILAPTV